MNIDEMKAEIARLQDAVRDEEKALRIAGQAALKEFVAEWEYSVEWKNEGEVRVMRRMTEASLAAQRAIIDAHPGVSVSSFSDPAKWEGMTYHITLGNYIIGGGGFCVLRSGGFGREERITPTELAALREGRVLPSLLHISR